jgi:hypothetical protein
MGGLCVVMKITSLDTRVYCSLLKFVTSLYCDGVRLFELHNSAKLSSLKCNVQVGLYCTGSITVRNNYRRYRLCKLQSLLLTVTAVFFFFFSSGPRAYASDAPQPVGLLCYPSVLDVPTFATSPSPRPCYPRDP